MRVGRNVLQPMMTPAVPEALSSAPLCMMSSPDFIFPLAREPCVDWPRWS